MTVKAQKQVLSKELEELEKQLLGYDDYSMYDKTLQDAILHGPKMTDLMDECLFEADR